MEVTIKRDDLVRELGLTQRIIERKASTPILAHVLAAAKDGEIRFSVTDLSLSLRCGAPAEVKLPGTLAIGAKKLFEIARSLTDGEVRIKTLPDAWVKVESGSSSFKIPGLAAEDFPTLPQAPSKGAVVPADVLADLIARTAFAITAEDARYYLAGALLILAPDAVTLVATDGHRLAYARRTAEVTGVTEEEVRALVPRKCIQELPRLLEAAGSATFAQVNNQLVFVAGARTLSCTTVEGHFPAFEKMIGQETTSRAVVSRGQLTEAVKRVSLLSSEHSRAIKWRLRKGEIELLASSPDAGEANETVPAEYEGDDVEIGFNAGYVLDFLNAAGTEKVSVSAKSGEHAAVFRPEGAEAIDYRCVVMPMRL